MKSEKKYWIVELTNQVRKQLKRIDKTIALELLDFIDELTFIEDIKELGKPLKGDHLGLYRFRKGNYRIIALIQDDKLLITVTAIGHRQGIYKGA
ncbi:MAG: type II toxin-antitoxin system RelE family toxin [Alphaproteobacteria bacterium]